MKEIYFEGAPKISAHYCPALLSGNTLYISGQLPLNPVTRVFVQGGAKQQALQCLKNIEKLLTQLGQTKNNIVKTTAYISDISLWDEVNEAYIEFFGNFKSTRTIVAVSSLHFGALCEIEAIATTD